MNFLWIFFAIFAGIILGIGMISDAYEIGDDSFYCAPGDISYVDDKGVWQCLELDSYIILVSGEREKLPMSLDFQTSLYKKISLNISKAENESYTMQIRSGRHFVYGGEI